MDRIKISLFSLLVMAAAIDYSSAASFDVNVGGDGSYTVFVDNVAWLTNASTEFNSEGKTYSNKDGSLQTKEIKTTTGTDKFGDWQAMNITYGAGSLQVTTTIKTYKNASVPVAIFSQRYLGEAKGTSAGTAQLVISKFPSFNLGVFLTELGYMAYGGDMTGHSDLKFGKMETDLLIPIGTSGGPLVIFDNKTNALVISPASQFMAASNSIDFSKQLNYGIMGMVDSVPQGYEVDFIIYFSDRGINEAMRGWGNYLKTVYGKTTDYRDNDLTVKYMGYWTDNGAYYYYNTEKGKNYEDTILDTDAYIKNESIPFQYLQFDSWWYTKGHKEGCRTWEPRPDVFPDGFNYVSQRTKLPFGCHNRFWDSDTTYAKANGGKYNFIIDSDTGYSVPDDNQFWLDLFNMTQSWGDFILYEQDWLDDETDRNAALLNDPLLGRRWLLGMGMGAQKFNITIQYCMSYSRHILQSLEIPVVTQARVSGDYQPGQNNWKIGASSMFADAVNIAPFKDTFWTTVTQAGSPYGDKTEPAIELVSAIATLSTGPVGPGDGIGYINKTLLMKCCDASGLILKPTKPMTAIDDQIRRLAYGSAYTGPEGEVYTSYTNITGYTFGIVLAADMLNEYSLTPETGWTEFTLPPSMAYAGMGIQTPPFSFSHKRGLKLGLDCGTVGFCLYYTSPVITATNGLIVLMGELDKWVPFSPQRFSSIQNPPGDVIIELNVQPGETVTFTYYIATEAAVGRIVCDNSKGSSQAPKSVISISKKSCTLG